jgi:hypothetical protein
MTTDNHSPSLDELILTAMDRGIVMPDPMTRESLLALLRDLPPPVTSRSMYAGKRVVRAKKYQAGGNPRRFASHGYNAYELIPLGDFGIRFEDLLARIKRLPAQTSKEYGAGGTNHIKWDLDHGNTYLIDDRPLRSSGSTNATPPRRKYDSSKTRVAPVLDAVSAYGRGWVRRLLSLPVGGAEGFALDPGLRLEPEATFWGDHERALDPPVALLSWLIRNLPVPPGADESGETGVRRQKLYDRDTGTIREALQRLRSDPSHKGWHVLEGRTYPDAVIETPDALIVIEGKRTERGPTTATTWMPVRHQMLRHLDCAWEIRGRRHVLGFFIVEGDQERRVPEAWTQAVGDTIAPANVAGSLPHRSQEERAQIATGFLGVTSWAEVCQMFRIPLEHLPDTVAAG